MPPEVAEALERYNFLRAFPGYTAQTMATEDAEVVRDLLTIHAGIAMGQAAAVK